MNSYSSLEQEITQLATGKKLLQFGLVEKDDLRKNVKTVVQMKCMLDNQCTASKSKSISSEQEYNDQKKVAVLYKRLSTNITEILVPNIMAQEEKDSEFTRMLKLVQQIPGGSNDKLAIIVSRMNMFKPQQVQAHPKSSYAPQTYEPLARQTTYPSFEGSGQANSGGYGSLGNSAQASGYPGAPTSGYGNQASGGYADLSSGYPQVQSQSTGGYGSLPSGGGYGSLPTSNTGASSSGYGSLPSQGAIQGGYGSLDQPAGSTAQPIGAYPGMGGYPSSFQTSAQSIGNHYSPPAQSSYGLPQTYAPITQAPSAPLVSQPSNPSHMNQPTSNHANPAVTGYQGDSGPQSLKTVVCPMDIVQKFLQIANPNTSNKIETLALLTGKEINGEYVITHLVIPHQTGKQDMCIMHDEMEIFEAQLQYEIMTLGWIHTHPQFDIFLSSVDLHNQLGYQQQLSEAIAIVYSPIVGNPPFKALRVKNKMANEILYCKHTAFHEHKDPSGGPAWEQCRHVRYAPAGSQKVEVLDLRRKAGY